MILRAARNTALGLATLSAAWLAASRAEACSCLGGSRVDWPAAGEVGVPLDAPIVVVGTGAFSSELPFLVTDADAGAAEPPDTDTGDGADVAPMPLPPIDPTTTAPAPSSDARGTDDSQSAPSTSEPGAAHSGTSESDSSGSLPHPQGLHLVSPEGAVAELWEAHQLPTSGCLGAYRIYEQSAGQLLPNTEYQLYDGDLFLRSFTTGDAPRNLSEEFLAAVAVQIETLGKSDEPSQVVHAYVTNIKVPMFVHYKGSSDEETYRLRGTETEVDFALGSLECPVIELLALDGAMRSYRTLCTPTKCKDVGDFVAVSSCGGNPSSGVSYEEFQTLSPGCGEPGGVNPPTTSPSTTSTPMPSATVTEGDSNHVTTGDQDGTAAGSETANADGAEPNKVALAGDGSSDGCAVGRPGSNDSSWSWLAAFGVAIGAVALRRRA